MGINQAIRCQTKQHLKVLHNPLQKEKYTSPIASQKQEKKEEKQGECKKREYQYAQLHFMEIKEFLRNWWGSSNDINIQTGSKIIM